MASPTALSARHGGPVPVSLGPVGGGLITGLGDLIALTGSGLFPLSVTWGLAREATETEELRARRVATAVSLGARRGQDESSSEEEDWVADLEDAGFGSGAGPVMREGLRVEELKRWEIKDRRLAAMRDKSPAEVGLEIGVEWWTVGDDSNGRSGTSSCRTRLVSATWSSRRPSAGTPGRGP